MNVLPGRNQRKAIEISIASLRKTAQIASAHSQKPQSNKASKSSKSPETSLHRKNLSSTDDQPICTQSKQRPPTVSSRFALLKNEDWLREVGINYPSSSTSSNPTTPKLEMSKGQASTKRATPNCGVSTTSNTPVTPESNSKLRLKHSRGRLGSPMPIDQVRTGVSNRFTLVSPEAFSKFYGLSSNPSTNQVLIEVNKDNPAQLSSPDNSSKPSPVQLDSDQQNEENVSPTLKKSCKNGLSSSRWAFSPAVQHKHNETIGTSTDLLVQDRAKPTELSPIETQPCPNDELVSLNGGLKSSIWASFDSQPREGCFYNQPLTIRRDSEASIRGSVKLMKMIGGEQVSLELRSSKAILLKNFLSQINISRLNAIFVIIQQISTGNPSATYTLQFPLPYMTNSFMQLARKYGTADPSKSSTEGENQIETENKSSFRLPNSDSNPGVTTPNEPGVDTVSKKQDDNSANVSGHPLLVDLSPELREKPVVTASMEGNIHDLLCLLDIETDVSHPKSTLEATFGELPRRSISIQDLLKLQDQAVAAPKLINQPERRPDINGDLASKVSRASKPALGSVVNVTRSGISVIPGSSPSVPFNNSNSYVSNKAHTEISTPKSTTKTNPTKHANHTASVMASPTTPQPEIDRLVGYFEELNLNSLSPIHQRSSITLADQAIKGGKGKIVPRLDASVPPFPGGFVTRTSHIVSQCPGNQAPGGYETSVMPRSDVIRPEGDGKSSLIDGKPDTKYSAHSSHGSRISVEAPGTPRQEPRLGHQISSPRSTPGFIQSPQNPVLGGLPMSPGAPAEATVLVLDPITGGYKEVTGYLKVGSIPIIATVPTPSLLQSNMMMESASQSVAAQPAPKDVVQSQIQARLDNSLKQRGKLRYSLG